MTATITKESLFRGNKEQSIQKIRDNGYNNTKNYSPITLKTLRLDQLESLETQRETRSNWVRDRLKDKDGLDWLAFGAISVALTPEGKYLVYDGLGRYNLAEHVGLTEIPCLVTEMSAKQACDAFAYNQSRGRRSMSPEALFVNNYVAGDPESQILAQIMKDAGL